MPCVSWRDDEQQAVSEDHVSSSSVGILQARGMYVCRTLSYLGATFDVRDCPLSPAMESQYKAAALLWTQLRSEFLYALGVSGKAESQPQADGEAPDADGRSKRSRQARTLGSRIWRAFWAAHQRFFRHMCMAAKVPHPSKAPQGWHEKASHCRLHVCSKLSLCPALCSCSSHQVKLGEALTQPSARAS